MSRRSRVREDITSLLKVGRIAKTHEKSRKQELTGEIKSAEGIIYRYNKLALIDPLFDPKENDTVSFSIIELSPGEYIATEVQECTQETFAAGTPKKILEQKATRTRKAPLKESNRNSLSSQIVYRASGNRPVPVVKIRKSSAAEKNAPKTPKNYGLKGTFDEDEIEEESSGDSGTQNVTVQYQWGKAEGYDVSSTLYKSVKLSFKSSSVEIKVGEYALIQDGDNVDNYFCCRVRELYENDNGEKIAKVTWFLTVDNYHKSIRRHKEAEKLRIKDYYDDEVVLVNDGLLSSEVEIETLIWKTRVFHADHRDKWYGDYGQKDKRYFCRWIYDGRKIKLSEIESSPADLKLLSSPEKKVSPIKIKMSKADVMKMFEESSEEEEETEIQSPKKMSVNQRKLKSVPDSDEESSEELPTIRRTRKQSSASSTESSSSTSSRRSARRRLLVDEEDSEPVKRSTAASRRKSDSAVSYDSKKTSTRKNTKSTLPSISETPSKALAGELEKMKLKKSSPKRKREVAKRTRRSVAVVQSTPVKKTASRRMSKSKSIAEEPETPSKQLAKEVESLTIRRSSRRSAIEANQAIKYGTHKEKHETLQCKTDEKLQRVEKGYKPECSSDSDEGSSGNTSSEVETDSDADIMKTPRKRARGWRGAKTPTKTPSKTPRKLSTKTPMKTPSKKGMADAVYKKSVAPSRQVLPDEILKSNDLLSILDQTSRRLDINSVPESLPCREDQYQNIYNFIEDKIKHNTGGCLYISGVPGTGKTATTHEVITALREEVDSGNLKKFKFVDVNGMRMTTPKQVYSAIWSQLTGEKRTADHASELLEAKFSGTEKSRGKTEPILMLVDELDQLMTRKQDVLYRIFDWPQRSKLIVIAIANTFDLPERVMMRRVASRLGLSRETFNPYTFKQLDEIIRARLGPNLSRLFEDSGLAFVSRKVASLSGDARRCLEICRQSVEQSILRYEETKDPRTVYITLQDIIKAVNAVSCNPAIVVMKACPTFAQIFLRGTVAAFRTLGVEEASVEDVIDHSGVIANMDGERKPETFELLQVAGYLETVGLILVDNLQSGIHAKVRLNVSPEDVLFALNTEKK